MLKTVFRRGDGGGDGFAPEPRTQFVPTVEVYLATPIKYQYLSYNILTANFRVIVKPPTVEAV